MFLLEIILNLDEKQVWGRSGKRIVRKYRCSSGKRRGRTVSKMSQCFVPVSFKKKLNLKRTKAKKGRAMTRKAQRSKRLNPLSKRLKTLNKRSSFRRSR